MFDEPRPQFSLRDFTQQVSALVTDLWNFRVTRLRNGALPLAQELQSLVDTALYGSLA